MIEKLKQRWGIQNNWEILVICIVFAATGSLSVWVSKPVLSFLHINKETLSPWFYWPLRILIVTPIYQVVLITLGTLAGQFNFFWNMEKKILGRFGVKFKENTDQ